jgi:hypothetical protein
MVAVTAAEFPVYPDPLAHGNPAGKRHVAVAQFRMLTKCPLCLYKQDTNPFLCHHLC